jgi:hypothetical protein
MSGPIILAILFVVAFLIAKFPTHAKKTYTYVGKALSSSAPEKPDTKTQWYKKYWWMVLVAGGVSYCLWAGIISIPTPSLRTTWEWTKDHWLWILFGIALAYVASYFKKEWEPAAKAARGVLIALVPVLFIGVPVVNAIWGDGPNSSQSQRAAAMAEVPLTSMPRAKWSTFNLPAGVGKKSAKIVYTAEMGGKHIVTKGVGFELYEEHADGKVCAGGGPCTTSPPVGAYVENTSGEAHSVPFAFESN